MPTIEVKFKERFPADLLEEMPKDGFLNLCRSVTAGEDARTFLFHPTPHEYHVLKLQLKELETEGALTFTDKPGDAP